MAHTTIEQFATELKLPPGCSGLSLFMNATLVDPSGAPLRPPVSSSRLVNIP